MGFKFGFFAAMLFAGIWFSGCIGGTPENPFPQNAAAVELQLKVSDAQQNVLFEGTKEFSLGTNALVAMQQMVKVNTQDSSFGKFVTGIQGLEAGSDYYWALYVNGEYASVGIVDIALDQDTQLEWKLEKIQTSPPNA